MPFMQNLWEIFLWTLWIFAFFAFIWVLFAVFGDLFGDKSLGGFAKTLWFIFIIIAPFLGLLIYLIARGKGMAERQAAKVAAAQEAQAAYIRQAAGTAASPTDQIASAKALLDSGAISQEEFNALKAKALSA